MTPPNTIAPSIPRAATTHSALEVLPGVEQQSFPAVEQLGTRTGWPTIAAYLVVDSVLIAAMLAATGWLVVVVAGDSFFPLAQSSRIGLVMLVTLVAAAAAHGLYRAIPVQPAVELQRWCLVIFIVLGAGALAALLASGGNAAVAVWMASAALPVAIAVFLGRATLRRVCSRATWWGVRVIVMGSGAATVGERLCQKPSWGMRPVGIVDDSQAAVGLPASLPWLAPPSDLGEAARRYRVQRVVVAMQGFDADEIVDLVSHPNARIRQWIVLPPLDRFPSLWNCARDIGGAPALEMPNLLSSPVRRGLKRLFDLSLTAVIAPVIFPLIGLIAVLVRASSRGPVFYSQERIGWHGRRFRAWKIRSMRPDADQVLAEYLAQNPHLRAEWLANHKLKNDPRITWVGRWLRITSLDELPQIWNVLRGEMSLIGPRPIVEAEIEKYGDQYEQYIQVLPGVTGLWQISGRNNTTYQERVEYDAYYVRNWSLWLDLYILACTARVVLLGEGAY